MHPYQNPSLLPSIERPGRPKGRQSHFNCALSCEASLFGSFARPVSWKKVQVNPAPAFLQSPLTPLFSFTLMHFSGSYVPYVIRYAGTLIFAGCCAALKPSYPIHYKYHHITTGLIIIGTIILNRASVAELLARHCPTEESQEAWVCECLPLIHCVLSIDPSITITHSFYSYDILVFLYLADFKIHSYSSLKMMGAKNYSRKTARNTK